MWFGTWKGLCRYDGYTFKTYRHNPEDSLSIADGAIFSLLEDEKGFLWVGTGGGLDRFDRRTEVFSHYLNKPTEPYRTKGPTIFGLCRDKQGVIWIGARNGLYGLKPDAPDMLRYVHDPADPHSLSDSHILCLYPGRDGLLWVGTAKGLNRFDPKTGKAVRFFPAPETPLNTGANRILCLEEHPDGSLWVGTKGGLFLVESSRMMASFRDSSGAVNAMLRDKHDGSWWLGTAGGLFHRAHPDAADMEAARYHPAAAEGLKSSYITALFKDTEGSLWIGTDNGIHLLTPETKQFRHYKNIPGEANSLSSNLIYCVFEGKDSQVWLGTHEGGLNSLNPATGAVHRFPYDNPTSPFSTNNSTVFRVYEDRTGTIWAGSLSGGLDRLDRRTNTFTHFKWGDIRDLISFFYEDKNSTLWIGHQGGVSRYDRASQAFEFAHYAPEMKGKSMLGVVTGILQDHTGAYWVSSNGYYLNRFDPHTQQYQRFLPNPKKPGSICSNNIQAIYEDQKGQIWAGTDKGLDLYNRENGTFRHFGLKDGLPDLMMGHLLEDGKGYLWIAAGKGISRFDPVAGTFRNYDKSDGLSCNESWDFVKSPATGAFLLATAEGLTIFHPDSLQDNTLPPPVVFTKLTRFDAKTGKTLEEKGIDGKTELTFSYLDDVLTIEFAALSFRKTAKNQYAYKLEGQHDDWAPLGTKRDVTFTNLRPGAYLLRIKGSNGDGIWNETGAALRLVITPPWWAAWWAWLLYAAAGLWVLFQVFRFQVKRRLVAAENLRLKDLDTAKTRLYTNITHEFRTPLTVINGMAEQIKEQPEQWLEEGLDTIRRNSQNLLGLVNQMLELRKLEAGMLPVRLIQGDIVAYVKYLAESFHSYAESKNIELTVVSQWEHFAMDFDPDKMLTIVSNLLSNAVKFTPPGGSITLAIGAPNGQADPELFEISVRDTGIGIPSEALPLIFDRFHQVNDGGAAGGGGTGIGLALTRELTQLLGGNIRAESTYGRGTVFTITLPVGRQAAPASDWPAVRQKAQWFQRQPAPDKQAPGASSEDKPLVQIVEDNADVVRYLRACLEPEYRLTVAPDGHAGIQRVFSDVPDLVVSDVMMPGMDGFEMCRQIKADERSSHIPVILLTARADMDSRLQGLRHGADIYLSKPFDKAELLLQIRNLLDSRKALQAHYLALASGAPASAVPGAPAEENAFVLKMRAIVEDHLADTAFDVDRFCREAGMSHSNLHRKLTALTGRSANQFIRHVRLSRACTLLRDPERTIAAVADDCGFNDPVYFARAFRQEFGVAPSEWRSKQ